MKFWLDLNRLIRNAVNILTLTFIAHFLQRTAMVIVWMYDCSHVDWISVCCYRFWRPDSTCSLSTKSTLTLHTRH